MKPIMLDWQKFKELTGSDSENFEKLCRSIVRRRFGRFGSLVERKNQPGVEFYIRLDQDCPELGDSGDKVGWQCKWFERRADGKLTSSAKGQILHSLGTTDEHVEDLNHWILWTPFTLAKADQKWFYRLQSDYSYKLHLWNANDIDNCLEGPALELRHAYFGELALTDDALEKRHRLSIAPIGGRWIKEIHHQVRVEKQLRQYLGEPSAWEEFKEAHTSLSEAYETIKKEVDEPVCSDWSEDLKSFLMFCSECLKFAEHFTNTLSAEDIESINGMLDHVKSLDLKIHTVLRQVRNRNFPLSIEITNALAYIKDIQNLLEEASEYLSCSFVAVLADAGGGKTHMATELTGVQPDRPAGILLHGRRFKKGSSLNDLAQEISFYGRKVPNFQALVAALDAAAHRGNCRLPIIIDGLSEAEEPREWKPELETAVELLKDYSNVLLICTLRTGQRQRQWVLPHSSNEAYSRETFAQMALPENCVCLECDGFGSSTMKAVKTYFKHYKIEADLIQIPKNFFSHPLNLRIFCEVTNRKAEKTVTVTRFPASITTLFGKQIEYAAKRIAEFTHFQQPYSEVNVQSSVFHLGKKLWESGKRQIPEADLLHSLDQLSRSWDENIINLLAQEGIIFRNPDDTPGVYFVTPVFDRLGGYIIADALLRENQSDSAFNWIRSQTNLQMLFGEGESNHSLSQDILHALVALVPRYSDNQKQLWMVVPDKYKEAVVELSTLIDPENLCDKTKEEYRKQILRKRLDYSTLRRLKGLCASGSHPLNADFLSDLLKDLSVAERDLSWTEFLRRNSDYMLSEIRYFEQRWKSDDISKTEGDRLTAVWFSWLLTSTSIDIRDYSTRSLYWYGRTCPKHLFEMTVSSLDINDPYVPERLLAASYGVVMYFVYKEICLEEMKWLVSRLYEHMFCESAKNSTTHLLARDYASKIINITRDLLPETLSEEELADSSPPYVSMPRQKWGPVDKSAIGFGYMSPLGMDFENYTIGRLVLERAPYDFDHPDYQDVRAKILWRIEQLGWSKESYAEIDERIATSSVSNSRMNRPKTERYGKKYSWIAYYEVAGQRLDEGALELRGERFAEDIDPSFPEPIYQRELQAAGYLGSSEMDTSDWIEKSGLPEIGDLTKIETLNGISGPWILLDGYVSEESREMDRNFYFTCRAFLVEEESSKKLISCWEEDTERRKIRLPEPIQTGYLYSGELNRLSYNSSNSDVEFELVVGTKVEKQEQRMFIGEDGIPVITDEGKLVDVEVPVKESIKVCSPVARFFWNAEDTAMPSVGAEVLTSRFTKTLDLKIDPVSLDFLDIEGNLAARNISFKGRGDNNRRSLFYIREDLLIKFMTEAKLDLIWFVRGERRTARFEHVRTSDLRYKIFRFCNTMKIN